MLPTFVIGLREGLEASLIVGIIAAFLGKQGRRDLLRWVFVGVSIAVALCLAAGAALEILSRNLPQRQQEGLETVVGALAVAMVSYMVVWMRRHSRELKGVLESAAADALANGSAKAGRALVIMAFLAVLREGLETVVFLLAAFNETGNGASPIIGAVLGIVIAVGLGYAIYRGGVRLNLSKFFRATGLVLVLVAGGLVVTAFHTAHEAGWLNSGQHQTVNLNWLAAPGTVRSSLLTGILGVQPHPVVIEIVGWFVYVIPLGLFVAWPPGRRIATRVLTRLAFTGAGLAAIAAVVLAIVAPAAVPSHPITNSSIGAAQFFASSSTSGSLRQFGEPGSGSVSTTVRRSGTTNLRGIGADTWVATDHAPGVTQRVSATTLAKANGGRLPIGINGGKSYTVTTVRATTITVTVDPVSHRVLDVSRITASQSTAKTLAGVVPAGSTSTSPFDWSSSDVAAAVVAARHTRATVSSRSDDLDGAIAAAVVAGVLLCFGAGAVVRPRVVSARGSEDASGPARPRHLIRA